MIRWEFILLWISFGIFLVALAMGIFSLTIFLLNQKAYKKYNVFHKKVYSLKIKNIEKGLQRLEIIAQKNTEYKNKYLEFEKKIEVIEKEIYELRTKIWKRHIPKSKKNRMSINTVIDKYTPYYARLESRRRSMEIKLLRLLQSDKYLDKEKSLLRIYFKKIKAKYLVEKVLHPSTNKVIDKKIDAIELFLLKFNQYYKKANWRSCATIINDIRLDLANLAAVVDKASKIAYWLYDYIPSLITINNEEYKKLKKLANTELVYIDYNSFNSYCQQKLELLSKKFDSTEVFNDYENQLISLTIKIVKMKNNIKYENQCCLYLKDNEENIFNKIKKMNKCFIFLDDEFHELINKSKTAKTFFSLKEIEYKSWLKGKESLKSKSFNLNQSWKNPDIPFSALISKISQIFSLIAQLELMQRNIHKSIYRHINTFTILTTQIRNIKIGLSALSIMTKRQPLISKKYTKDILDIINKVKEISKDVSVQHFKKAASLAKKVDKIRLLFIELKMEIENQFTLITMHSLLIEFIDDSANKQNTKQLRISKSFLENTSNYSYRLINNILHNMDWGVWNEI